MYGNAAVSGNTAYSSYRSSSASSYSDGGGVYIGGGSFTKIGGVIYGNNEADATLQNIIVVQGDKLTYSGSAIYADNSHRRDTTVTAEQNMTKSDSSYTGQWTD